MAKSVIIILSLIILMNLFLTVWNVEYSYIHMLSSSSVKIGEEWTLRAQIGDLLSGHFSALAVFAVAYSIILQHEANAQLRGSIKQQGEALALQSTSLEKQIEEMQEARKETLNQTEEFLINNVNMRLDRYYKILDKKLDNLRKRDIREYAKYSNILKNKNINTPKIDDIVNNALFVTSSKEAEEKLPILEDSFEEIFEVMEFIYVNIMYFHSQGDNNKHASFIGEFEIRIYSDKTLFLLLQTYDFESKYEFESYLVECGINEPTHTKYST